MSLSAVVHPPAEQLVHNHDVEQEDEHSGIHSAARAAGGAPGGSTAHARSPGPGGKEQNGSAGHLQDDHRMITEDERREEGFCVQIVLCASLRWTT